MNRWIRSHESLHCFALLVLAFFALFISSSALAICIPTVYNVIPAAPPPMDMPRCGVDGAVQFSNSYPSVERESKR